MRRSGRILLKIAAAAAGLAAAAVAGLYLWLGTEAGARAAFGLMQNLAASGGLTLTARSFEGPLPRRLKAEALRLEGGRGLLFSAEALEVELEPGALLAGLVHLTRIRLTGPVFFPPKADDRDGGPLPRLPLRLRLDELILAGGRLETGAPGPWPLAGRGALNLNLATARAEARLDLTLGRPAGAGELNLKADLAWEEKTGLAADNLNLAGAHWRWPEGPAAGILGQDWLARGNLAVQPSGALAFLLERFESGGLGLSGHGDWNPGPAGGELSLDLEARLENLAGPLPGWSGPVEARVRGGGRPAELLTAQVEARGLASAQGAALSGNVTYAVPDKTLVLEGLDIRAAGLALAGGLSIDLKGEEPALKGRLTGQAPDWAFPALPEGRELRGGPARLALDLDSGQKADLELELSGLALGPPAAPELTLAQARARLAADDLFGRQEFRLNLDLGPGRAAGLAWTGGEIKAEAKGGQGTWSLDFSAVSDRAGPKGRDRLTAGGGFDLGRSAAEVARLELQAGPAGLKLARPVALSWAEELKVSPVKARILPAGELNLDAKLGSDELSLKAEIKRLPYRFLSFLADLPEGQVQSLTLDLERRGPDYAGGFTLKTSLAPGTIGRLTPELNLAGRLEGRALTARGTLSGGPGWPATGRIDLSLPLTPGREDAPPRPDLEAPLSGRLDFSGPLEPLWSLADLHDRALTGQVSIGLDLEGSLARPRLAGALRLAGGRYEDRVLGLWLRDLNINAEGRPDQSFQVTLAGRDLGRGQLSLAGEIRDLARPTLKAEGSLKSFRPFRRDDLSLTLSGGLGLDGPLNRLTVTSDLTLEEGGLNLNLLSGSGSIATLPLSEPEETEAGESPLQLDLKLNAPGHLNITGYGLESEWRGWLRVKGPPGRQLALTGELRPLRGWYEPPVFNKQFNFERGRVAFTGGPIPFLDLELTNQSPELTAIIKISGPARQPQVSLTSRPPMNQDEVAGRLLFGKSPSSISRLEALQLAVVLRDLTNFGGDSLNPLKTVRRSLGLDVLRLGGASGQSERPVSELSGSLAGDLNTRAGERAENEAVSVEAGKYINDNIYMGVEHGSDGPAMRLEVELAPSISLEARSSPESSQVGLGWKKDY